MSHSPFHVIENFISPLQCERLVEELALRAPSIAENGQPLKFERIVPPHLAGNLKDNLIDEMGAIEKKFNGTLFGEPVALFQQYWENPKSPAELHGCENSKYQRKKWTKVKDVDLVGILWLKDFHNSVPLDPRVEVYGGKIEFPVYDFSLTPVRGTLVIFPATPHFVTATSHVMLGTLEQIKIGISLRKQGLPWEYIPSDYPGSYQEWFTEAQ